MCTSMSRRIIVVPSVDEQALTRRDGREEPPRSHLRPTRELHPCCYERTNECMSLIARAGPEGRAAGRRSVFLQSSTQSIVLSKERIIGSRDRRWTIENGCMEWIGPQTGTQRSGFLQVSSHSG